MEFCQLRSGKGHSSEERNIQNCIWVLTRFVLGLLLFFCNRSVNFIKTDNDISQSGVWPLLHEVCNAVFEYFLGQSLGNRFVNFCQRLYFQIIRLEVLHETVKFGHFLTKHQSDCCRFPQLRWKLMHHSELSREFCVGKLLIDAFWMHEWWKNRWICPQQFVVTVPVLTPHNE